MWVSHLKYTEFQRPQQRLGGKMGGQRPGDVFLVTKWPPLAFCADMESSVLFYEDRCGESWKRWRGEVDQFHFSWQRGSCTQRRIAGLRERP